MSDGLWEEWKARKEDSLSEPYRAASARRTTTTTPTKGIIPHARQNSQSARVCRPLGGVESVILVAFTVPGGRCKERKEEKCILIYIYLI
jgi:hypothetical protein